MSIFTGLAVAACAYVLVIVLFFSLFFLGVLAIQTWELAIEYWYLSLILALLCLFYAIGKKEVDRQNASLTPEH